MRQIPLKLVLIIPFVLQVVGAVGLVGYLSYRSGQNAVNNLAYQVMNQASSRIRDRLDLVLQEQHQALVFDAQSIEQGTVKINNPEAIRQHLWQQINSSSFVVNSFIANDQGEEVSYLRFFSPEVIKQAEKLTGETLQPGMIALGIVTLSHPNQRVYSLVDRQGRARKTIYTMPVDPRTTPWYLAAKNRTQPSWSSIFTYRAIPSLGISIGISIYDAEQRRQIILANAVALADLGTFLKQLNFSPSGQAFILEPSGNLVATSTLELPFIRQPPKQPTRLAATQSQDPVTQAIAVQLKQDYGNLAKIQMKTFLSTSLADKKLLAQVEPYRDKYGLNWLLVTVIPESDFMEEINANTKITILLCFLTLVIAIGFGLVITHWVTKPIKQLSQASKAIAQGEWQYENNQTNRIFNNQAITEINTFADSFYSMANQLKTILDSLENRVEQRTAELVIEKKKVEIANQAKSSFIANMSHELRSPLNAVIGFSQLILRTKNLPKEQYEIAGIIQRSGEYLLTLINNILDFSKIEAGKTTLNQKDFDLDQLLDNLEDMLYLRAFDAGLELIFDRGDNLPRYIYTDEIKLRQILLNLLSNAIKFTQKGEVILSVRYDPPLLTENHFLQFTVKDTGKGISQEELSKLFEAFLQTESGKESQEGTGLGLVISRQFVQLMGGDIAVKSELNQGTTFDFSIQIKLGKETQESNKSIQRVLALAPDQPIYKILAVDDKPINCQLLVKLLTPLGFEVKEAANGEEAIAIWEAWEPHLIFMDMRMPVMDGYEATKYIKAQVKGSATAVVVLTASVLEEEKVIVLSAGCDDFIRKPFKENMIFEALTKHLGVTYIYEQNQEQDHSSLETAKLSTKNFEIMPQQWLRQLSEAALEANTEEVITLIGEISSTEIFLTQSLTKLVRKFEFEQILDLINPLLED